ncbi:hypothetical protein PYW08_015511 [Mythimna loreyi]|uniref:Uncharacterized protein n=1 Tax=Mythimna loreyi TaxID=667449 RepID=A0ACC2QWE6_9NEOP|nr:hypothetical protein PYW08_015511 [Mythimna loreyi]
MTPWPRQGSILFFWYCTGIGVFMPLLNAGTLELAGLRTRTMTLARSTHCAFTTFKVSFLRTMTTGKIIAIFCVLYVFTMNVDGQTKCNSTGRFVIEGSSCKNYTLCVYTVFTNGSEALIPYNYTCPGTSVFNKMKGKCTSPNVYKC